jgi:hypothetical protein
MTTFVFSNSSSISVQTRLNINTTQGQRIAGIIMMTVINRHYCIEYQPRKIVTLQYHDNRETLFLTHIDRRLLYYFLDERFSSRQMLAAGTCIIF